MRERLRQIQQKIESDPQAQTLKLELKTYHAWLKTISQADKAKIDQAKTIEDRLNVIRDIKANQDRIQGTLDQQPARNFRDHEIVNLYPTVPELAEFLESLDPERLEILLGHTPSNFLYQLEKEYRDEAEEKTK